MARSLPLLITPAAPDRSSSLSLKPVSKSRTLCLSHKRSSQFPSSPPSKGAQKGRARGIPGAIGFEAFTPSLENPSTSRPVALALSYEKVVSSTSSIASGSGCCRVSTDTGSNASESKSKDKLKHIYITDCNCYQTLAHNIDITACNILSKGYAALE